MSTSFLKQTKCAFQISDQEWLALSDTMKLERLLDHAVDLLEVHELRLNMENGPAAAFRREFGAPKKAETKVVRIPDLSITKVRASIARGEENRSEQRRKLDRRSTD